MIWKKLANLILKNRLAILFIVLAASVFMGFEASKVRLTYNAGKILPVTDSATSGTPLSIKCLARMLRP